MEQWAPPIRYVKWLGDVLDRPEEVLGRVSERFAALGNRELSCLTNTVAFYSVAQILVVPLSMNRTDISFFFSTTKSGHIEILLKVHVHWLGIL